MHLVILCGGTGSRLWPLSRELRPKQFLTLFGDQTLLQSTLGRVDGLPHNGSILICNEEHRFLVAEQVRQVGVKAQILLEPQGRNTAPAIALAALQAMNIADDPVLLVLAADHFIEDVNAFQEAVLAGKKLAEDGRLVTFGIVPSHVETGYGYIQRGARLDLTGFEVARFVEKPDYKTAEEYVASGEFFWNSGMFMFRASCYLKELQRHAPEIFTACKQSLDEGKVDMDFIRVGVEAFNYCPDNSIDYAVMEKTDRAAMVSLDAGWSDIGSWSALWDVSEKDDELNVLSGDVLVEDTVRSIIKSEHRLVATLGVDGLVVIETKDAVLIANKERTQDVKKIVERLKIEGRSESKNHREVYRPWGVYDSIAKGDRYQVKHITVKPGAKLSVQMHHHRAEHWVVVSGTARVTNGEKSYLVSENESTFIPIGQVHALENPGVIPLELIEVQSGSYLGEDDIVRLKDRYGRC